MRTEKEILLDHIGPEYFEHPETRDLRFHNARRSELLDICEMHGVEVDRNQPKIITDMDGNARGLVMRMRNWNDEGRFNDPPLNDRGRPMTIWEWRRQRGKQPRKETEAA